MNDKTKDPAQGTDMTDAYVGAREDLEDWKRRALAAEDLNRKFIREIKGPTHMGEPVSQGADARPVAIDVNAVARSEYWKAEHIEANKEINRLRAMLSARDAAPSDALTQALAEIERLNAIINTPHADDFMCAVSIEAEHQRQRWGAEGDAGKTPADWFWLVGYLAGKALHSHAAGNIEKGEHHVITTAAACANWHLALFGKTDMRPGHEEGVGLIAASAPREET